MATLSNGTRVETVSQLDAYLEDLGWDVHRLANGCGKYALSVDGRDEYYVIHLDRDGHPYTAACETHAIGVGQSGLKERREQIARAADWARSVTPGRA